MNCFECARSGSKTTAVALCRDCQAGLCLDHLRAAATAPAKGGTYTSCAHVTWQVGSWPEALRVAQ